jgi:integrase
VAVWRPHQLRHAAAAAIAEAFAAEGLEAARVALGHHTLDITDYYARRDESLARRVAAAVG